MIQFEMDVYKKFQWITWYIRANKVKITIYYKIMAWTIVSVDFCPECHDFEFSLLCFTIAFNKLKKRSKRA